MNIIETIQKFDRPPRIPGESPEARKHRRHDIEKFREVRDTMQKLIDLTNTMGCEEQVVAGMVEGLVRTHRFLQGKGVQCLFRALAAFGSLPEERFTDARNAFEHGLCKLLRERFEDEMFWKDSE